MLMGFKSYPGGHKASMLLFTYVLEEYSSLFCNITCNSVHHIFSFPLLSQASPKNCCNPYCETLVHVLAAFIFLKLWWYCLLTKLPFFYRVKLWNVVDMQNFLQVLAVSIMKCGTRRAAKYWIVVMIKTGERKVISCPKRRKGRSYKKKLSIVWKAVETVRAKYDPGLISYSRFQYTQGYSEAQLLYYFFF